MEQQPQKERETKAFLLLLSFEWSAIRIHFPQDFRFLRHMNFHNDEIKMVWLHSTAHICTHIEQLFGIWDRSEKAFNDNHNSAQQADAPEGSFHSNWLYTQFALYRLISVHK